MSKSNTNIMLISFRLSIADTHSRTSHPIDITVCEQPHRYAYITIKQSYMPDHPNMITSKSYDKHLSQ